MCIRDRSYAAEVDSVAQEVMSEVKNIEAEYQALDVYKRQVQNKIL